MKITTAEVKILIKECVKTCGMYTAADFKNYIIKKSGKDVTRNQITGAIGQLMDTKDIVRVERGLYAKDINHIDNSVEANNDDQLIESLKKYRMNKAQEKNLPPYYIFNDITLNEIIAYKPTTIEELLAIKGFGPKKCDWYGEDILDIIRSL